MRIYLYRFLFFGMIILPSLAWAQSNTEMVPEKLADNELKINMFYLLLFGPEVVYERIITNSSAAGFSALISFSGHPDIAAGTVYYRAFFGEGRASGMFIEGSGSLLAGDLVDYDVPLGFGFAVGKKYTNRNNVTVELLAGVGRVIATKLDEGLYPRFGIFIGTRY